MNMMESQCLNRLVNIIQTSREPITEITASKNHMEGNRISFEVLVEGEMMSITDVDKILMMFCATQDIHPVLFKPFNHGNFTYATNGYIAIRVPLIKKYNHKKLVPNMNDIWFNTLPERGWMDVPDIEKEVGYNDCDVCKGKGKYFSCGCPACQTARHVKESCDTCKGTGYVFKQESILVGTKLLSCLYLDIIHKLPNPQISPDSVIGRTAIPFKFDGGDGIIMPMLKKDKV